MVVLYWAGNGDFFEFPISRFIILMSLSV